MAIYSAEERIELEDALTGSGIVPANLDHNLVGVIKALVSMATHARQLRMDADADIEVIRVAARELERQVRELSGQCDGYRQLVWTLIRRLGGTTHIEATELEICPTLPAIYIGQAPDGGWDIVAELPEPTVTEVNATLNGNGEQES